MTARLARALALLAFVAAGPAFTQPLQYKVRIEAPRELREMLAERLPLARWQGDPQMTEPLLLRLVAEAEADVREAVATRGYFSARVRSRIDRAEQPWTVVLEVEPGEPARIAHAEVMFSGPAAQAPDAAPLLERIRREWTLRRGARFTQDAWNDAKRDATRALAGWRYAAARVASSRADIDPKAGEARLQVGIESGPAFHYGETDVRGTDRYPDDMVAGLSPAEPGAPYDRETLDLYERRLLATGYFVSAQAALDADPARAGAAPVRVAVIEGRSQQFETGLSFNTDVGLRAEARYRNMDIFDTAYRFKSEVQLDSRIRQGRLDLDTPPRAGGRWQSTFVQARDTNIQNEENVELSAGIAHNWGLGGPLSALFVSAHVEEQRLSGMLADHRQAVFFGYRTQWRDTDRWDVPRRGWLAEVSVGGAPRALASRQFTRATARALLLIPLGRHDFQLRGEAGAVLADARDGIPSSFLFRTGGDQTIRGYAFESLGVPSGGAVVGGRYLALASAEYTHWVGESWGLAAFADAGDAWDGSQFEPVVGAGAGVRFRTPIGPVRGDLAYGFEEKSWRLHFSVGFIF
jgi:translocation and assembly module TamA